MSESRQMNVWRRDYQKRHTETESLRAQVVALRDKLSTINICTAAGNRTLDEMIRDMGYANDIARAALAMSKSEGLPKDQDGRPS